MTRTETDPTRPQRLLAEYLADPDLPCPNCAYNLRGLTTDRCPECGVRPRLELRVPEPSETSYVAALVGSCLGLGGSTLFSLIAISYAPSGWWAQTSSRFLLALQALCAATTPMILLSKRRFQTARPATRWFLAAMMWAFVLSLSAAFVLYFNG